MLITKSGSSAMLRCAITPLACQGRQRRPLLAVGAPLVAALLLTPGVTRAAVFRFCQRRLFRVHRLSGPVVARALRLHETDSHRRFR